MLRLHARVSGSSGYDQKEPTSQCASHVWRVHNPKYCSFKYYPICDSIMDEQLRSKRSYIAACDEGKMYELHQNIDTKHDEQALIWVVSLQNG
jgi:hypothetical protein